ncbi:hypothetical protein KSP39_PZI005886 [Platanthera zijinensis]|uniref:Uncharacterized protein n=1 Tax=Platanthera zijinensis TaxID=2320716 RepID=A0AAP0BRJ7_9ASPA
MFTRPTNFVFRLHTMDTDLFPSNKLCSGNMPSSILHYLRPSSSSQLIKIPCRATYYLIYTADRPTYPSSFLSKSIRAKEGKECGLVDAIVSLENLLMVARSWALEIASGSKPWISSLK